MKRRIHIALFDINSGWENVLDQIGASWEYVETTAEVNIRNFSCLILNKKADRDQYAAVENFLSGGGAVLNTMAGIDLVKPVEKKIKRINPAKDSNTPFSHIEPFNLTLPSKTVEAGQFLSKTIYLSNRPDRSYAFIGIHPDQFYSGYKQTSRRFQHSVHPSVIERTTAVPGFQFFQIVLQLLIILHEKSGIPFVHKWWQPDTSQPMFTFRIDSDFGTDETVQSLNTVLTLHNIRATWFLHTTAHENSDLNRLTQNGSELALHCYNHTEYTKKKQYTDDIKKGLQFFEQKELKPAGYAAPYGNWTRAVQQAIDESGFAYSSEFCYDFDTLPSTPADGRTLQVPVHPVSIGTLKRFGYTEKMMTDYFDELIKLKSLLFQPVNLYHHPNDGHNDVLEKLFAAVKQQNFRVKTYSEFADWWKKRTAEKCLFEYSDEGLVISNEYPVAVHVNNNISITDDIHISIPDLKFVSFPGQDLSGLLQKRLQNQTLSRFKLQKYAILSWLWRNKG